MNTNLRTHSPAPYMTLFTDLDHHWYVCSDYQGIPVVRYQLHTSEHALYLLNSTELTYTPLHRIVPRPETLLTYPVTYVDHQYVQKIFHLTGMHPQRRLIDLKHFDHTADLTDTYHQSATGQVVALVYVQGLFALCLDRVNMIDYTFMTTEVISHWEFSTLFTPAPLGQADFVLAHLNG